MTPCHRYHHLRRKQQFGSERRIHTAGWLSVYKVWIILSRKHHLDNPAILSCPFKGRNTRIHTMTAVRRDCSDALAASVVVNMQQAETFGAFGCLFPCWNCYWFQAVTREPVICVVLCWDWCYTGTGGVNMGIFWCPKTSPCSTFLYLPWILMKTKARQGKNGHEDTLNKNPTPHCSQV